MIAASLLDCYWYWTQEEQEEEAYENGVVGKSFAHFAAVGIASESLVA